MPRQAKQLPQPKIQQIFQAHLAKLVRPLPAFPQRSRGHRAWLSGFPIQHENPEGTYMSEHTPESATEQTKMWAAVYRDTNGGTYSLRNMGTLAKPPANILELPLAQRTEMVLKAAV